MHATASVHLLVAALAVALWVLERQFSPEMIVSPVATLVGVSAVVITSCTATWFAVRAWRHQLAIETTSVWDPATSFAQLLAAVLLTYSLGGFAGAGWGLVLVLLPYFGVVFESGQLRLLAVGSGVAVAAAGILAGTATAALVPIAVVVVSATVLGMWFTEQSATYMFEMRRQAQRQRQAVEVARRGDLRRPRRRRAR